MATVACGPTPGICEAAPASDGAGALAAGARSSTLPPTDGAPSWLDRYASASVHTAEMFTSGVSGLSHLKFGNVDRALFKRLVLPGVVGGMIGAYLLVSLPGDKLKPWVALYLLVMGVMVFRRAFGKYLPEPSTKGLRRLGLAGGFLDPVGGGGWGPVVTSTLVANGRAPRYAIGSVNLAEFFVATAQAATFFLTIGLVHWKIILGLIAGGVLAAPIAAHLCKRIPTRPLMIMVGLLIVALSARTMVLSLR